MIENQNAGVTQKKKKYGRLKDFICFFVAAFISFSQVRPIWAAEGTRVFDEAGLFSAEEVQELETRIDEVRDSQDADLAVLTVEDAQGESAESYADDFYDSHGLGVGDDASGILLSIDMDNREIYVSTTGYAMKVLTDARVEKVLDAAYDSVADGNYAEGALGRSTASKIIWRWAFRRDSIRRCARRKNIPWNGMRRCLRRSRLQSLRHSRAFR